MLAGPFAERDAQFYDSLADSWERLKDLSCETWIKPYCCPETAQEYCSD